jgi:hypothetical protein
MHAFGVRGPKIAPRIPPDACLHAGGWPEHFV